MKINECIQQSYVCALPDMYTRIPRAAGSRDEGVHIRQNISVCVTTISYVPYGTNF